MGITPEKVMACKRGDYNFPRYEIYEPTILGEINAAIKLDQIPSESVANSIKLILKLHEECSCVHISDGRKMKWIVENEEAMKNLMERYKEAKKRQREITNENNSK
jgi:hypothetical protein